LGATAVIVQNRSGPTRRIHVAAKKSPLQYQVTNPWAFQDELAIFLEEEEFDIMVSRNTISCLLKEAGISRKRGQRVGHIQSQQLRTDEWQAFVLDIREEQLVTYRRVCYKKQTG